MTRSSSKKYSLGFAVYLVLTILLSTNIPGTLGELTSRYQAFSLIVLVIIGLSILLECNQLRLFLPNRNIICVILFNILLISFFRHDIMQSVRHWTAIVLTLLIVLNFTTLLHSIRLEKALLLFATCLTVAVSVSALVHLGTVGKMTFFNHDGLTRVGGIFYFADNANMASISILLSVISFQLSREKKRIAWLIIFNISLCSVVMASADTKSAMLAVIVALSFIFLFNKVKRLLKVLLILVVAITCYIGAMYLKSPGSQAENADKLMIRNMIWELSISGIKQRPLVGYGNKVNFFQLSIDGQRISKELNDAHNSHLMHMLIFGIPSYIIFVLMIMSIIKNGIQFYAHGFQVLHSIMIYWFIMSFFWGRIFSLVGFPRIIFMLSLLGIMCHPDAYKQIAPHKRLYIYKISL